MDYYKVVKPPKNSQYKAGDIITVPAGATTKQYVRRVKPATEPDTVIRRLMPGGKVMDIWALPFTLDLRDKEYFTPLKEYNEAESIG